MSDDETWERLAERIRERRLELGLTQTQLARDAQASDRTIGALERAEQARYHAATLRSVAVALGWTPDSVERILAGDEPVDAPSRDPNVDLLPLIFDLQRRVEVLERELGIRRDDDPLEELGQPPSRQLGRRRATAAGSPKRAG